MSLSPPPAAQISSLQTLFSNSPFSSSLSSSSPDPLLPTPPLPSSSPHQSLHQQVVLQQTLHNQTLQVLHNLRHQHDWSSLQLHNLPSKKPLQRPLISGLPPTRLYVHPDEQVSHLAALKAAREREATAAQPPAADVSAAPPRSANSPAHPPSPPTNSSASRGVQTPLPEEGTSRASSHSLPVSAPTSISNQTSTPSSALEAELELEPQPEPEPEPEPSVADLIHAYEAPEAEWVLPARIDEEWSLRDLAAVFEAIDLEPPDLPASTSTTGGEGGFFYVERERDREWAGQGEGGANDWRDGVGEPGQRGGKRERGGEYGERERWGGNGEWERGGQYGEKERREGNGEKDREGKRESRKKAKRIVLAIVNDDSTVVYYIVHERIVKPRQN